MTGSQSRESFTPGQTSDSSSNTRGKSRMHQRARTDPSGGRGATRVPTGTQGNADLVIPEGASGASVLIVGGTGGVGSMAVQLARQLTSLTVVTTSFDDKQERQWCRRNGADHVLDHAKPIAAQVAALKIAPVKF